MAAKTRRIEPDLTLVADDFTLVDMLLKRVEETPDCKLFERDNGDGTWSAVEAKKFLSEVRGVAKGLLAAGIKPGQTVGIMSHTRYEWVVLDFAIWFAGGVVVPIYESSAPAQLEWILANSDSVGVFLENESTFQRFAEVVGNLHQVKHVWRIDQNCLDDLTALGASVTDEVLAERSQLAKKTDLATLIYTSGTTGLPKGCELTHANFVDLSYNAINALPEVLRDCHRTLLFLPMAHVYARFISMVCVAAGITVAHQDNMKKISESMQSFKPDFLLAVPRVLEKVYNSAEQKAEANGKGVIFRRAASVAIAYSSALQDQAFEGGKGPSLKVRALFAVYNKLVYGKIRAAMGGELGYAVSGGGPLGERLGHFFRAIGVTVLEGYGLTETTGPAMITRPTTIKIGKVGNSLPGTEGKIAEDGEILLRGINTFRGYWRNPAANAESFVDGWFRTGDLGKLDEDGYLSIIGRKKEIIVTAGGKNVAPAVLEDPLRAHPLISQAVVIGDRKPFVAALISLDPEMLPIWLANNGGDKNMSVQNAGESELVRKEIQHAIDRVNRHVSQAESIRKFEILPIELSEGSGHVTPSMKVKRAAVASDFAEYVDRIYGTDDVDTMAHDIKG
jgi:long-chain acyl-CoA synthetase